MRAVTPLRDWEEKSLGLGARAKKKQLSALIFSLRNEARVALSKRAMR